MKNLLCLLLLSFALTANANTLVDYASTDVPVDCYEYAINSTDAEIETYGLIYDDFTYIETALIYFNACEDADGNIADTVFL